MAYDRATFKAEALFGSVDLQARMRQEGSTLIGEGRRIERDMAGRTKSESPWAPTGLVVHLAPERKPWWKVW